MTHNRTGEEGRPPRSGLPPDDLDPSTVWLRTEVLLAQAETLGRLRRTEDQQRKLLWTFAVAFDCFELHSDSVIAALNAARVARAAGMFDIAMKLLRIARNLKPDQNDSLAILVHEHKEKREQEIDAGGSREAMAQQLIIHACHRCGRLIEYISIPCMFCGWQPLTLSEVSQSGRLATRWFSLWDLLGIGRGIVAGRKASEVVSNLAESAVASMGNPTYKRYVETTLDVAQRKRADGFFCYVHGSSCQNCGASLPLHNPFLTKCPNCQTKLRIPPPLKLLSCLARTSIHFQHDLGAEPPDDLDLFIRYLVSLQSKLFRQQETPSSAERNRVVELMARLGEFTVVNDFGSIITRDPKKIVFRQRHTLADADKARAVTVLEDFTSTLQFLANWMFRTKALC